MERLSALRHRRLRRQMSGRDVLEGRSVLDLKTTRYEIDDRIATITLARPKRRNAWTGRMHTEYRWCLLQADQDPQVRVIVVTGDPEGNAFCAGADLGALEGHAEKGRYDPGTDDDIARPGFGVDPRFDASFAYHFGLAKPVIASINGAAAGVGRHGRTRRLYGCKASFRNFSSPN